MYIRYCIEVVTGEDKCLLFVIMLPAEDLFLSTIRWHEVILDGTVLDQDSMHSPVPADKALRFSSPSQHPFQPHSSKFFKWKIFHTSTNNIKDMLLPQFEKIHCDFGEE